LHGRDGDVLTRPPLKGRTSDENHNCSANHLQLKGKRNDPSGRVPLWAIGGRL
jgi:hypothetical protein